MRTLRALEPGIKPKTAGVKATRMLANERFRAEVEKEMRDRFSKEEVEKVLKRNLKQEKNISASNQAADIIIRVTGDYAPEKKTNLNIKIDDPDAFVANLLKEYERIKGLESPQLPPE